MFYEVEVIVGHCCSDGRTLPAQQVAAIVSEGLLVFAHLFRGAYALGCIGSYLNDEDIAFTEPTTILKVYTLNEDSLMPHLVIFAGEIATALQQECVMLVTKEVEGTIQFVKPADHSITKFLLPGRQMQPLRPLLSLKESKTVSGFNQKSSTNLEILNDDPLLVENQQIVLYVKKEPTSGSQSE